MNDNLLNKKSLHNSPPLTIAAISAMMQNGAGHCRSMSVLIDATKRKHSSSLLGKETVAQGQVLVCDSRSNNSPDHAQWLLDSCPCGWLSSFGRGHSGCRWNKCAPSVGSEHKENCFMP